MTVTVRLVEASQAQITKLTQLCKVSGKIPVYADDGRATGAYGREIQGCRMPWKGKHLDVIVLGALAVAHGPATIATAFISVVPPDAKPICVTSCEPRPLAVSRADIRVSGAIHALKFSLSPDPGSVLNAVPTVWLEADVEVVN
jgi:hypothetical protein